MLLICILFEALCLDVCCQKCFVDFFVFLMLELKYLTLYIPTRVSASLEVLRYF